MRTLIGRALFAAGLVALYVATAATYAHSPPAATLLPAAALVAGLGVFVLGRSPGARLNRAFALVCLCVTAWLSTVYLAYMSAAVWGYEAVLWPMAFLRVGPIFAVPALLWFTHEIMRGPGRLGRSLVISAFLSMAPFVFLDPFLTNRRDLGGKYVPSSTSYRFLAVFAIFWLLVWVATVVRGSLRGTPTASRTRCRICLVAALPTVLSGILAFVPAFGGESFPPSLGIMVAFFPAAMGFSVLRYQMFDIKLAIRRTLPYAAMTGLIGVAYALVVTSIRDFGHVAGGPPRGTELVALAILVGLGFQPTLEALQRALDRAFFRAEAELDRYLAGASGRYGAAATADEVAAMAAEDAREMIEFEWAAMLLGSEAADIRSCGHAPPALGGAAARALALLPRGRGPIDLAGGDASLEGDSAGPLREALAETGCRLAVPLDVPGGRGLLLCGEKRSGVPLGARDVTFVVALAAQAEGAIARVESRAEAEQLKELTGAVLASLANSVALVDADGRVVTCNPIFRGNFGGEPGAHISDLGLSDLVRPAALPLEVCAGGRTYVASGRRLEGERGGPASVIVLTDVTELRRLQDEAGRREALAKVGAAVASINHEIRNVLTPVTAYIDVAHRQCGTEEARKALGSAQSRLAALRRLGDELRDYYREPELSLTAVRLADVIAGCLGDLQASAGDQWSPPDLGGLDLTLRADPQKLKQVFLNVLKNAWEAMATMKRRDWSVRARREDGRAIIEVHDSGVGLAPTAAGRVFEPFFSTKRGSGTGLGLAIARRITEAHGGQIALSGDSGPGATATVTWPLASGDGGRTDPVPLR